MFLRKKQKILFYAFPKIQNGFWSSHLIILFTPLDRNGFWWNLGFQKAETESFKMAQKSWKSDTIWCGKRPAESWAQFCFETRNNCYIFVPSYLKKICWEIRMNIFFLGPPKYIFKHFVSRATKCNVYLFVFLFLEYICL